MSEVNNLAPDLSFIADYRAALRRVSPHHFGRLTSVAGLTIRARGLSDAALSDLCYLSPEDGAVACEVSAFHGDQTILAPLGAVDRLRRDQLVLFRGEPLTVASGPALLGRVLDGLGRPIDGRGPLKAASIDARPRPPAALTRQPIDQVYVTGLPVIDAFLTVGRGQRVGIFGGSGVGKSTLLAMIARYHRILRGARALTVIGLVGERGREVREFLEETLGPEGLAGSVVVCATSDEPANVRLRAAWTATAIACDLRDRGFDVTFILDSVTRVAMAQREIGLAAGEGPTSRGYPPSLFAMLPRLLECSGNSERGTMTTFYGVLMEGDDTEDLLVDTARSILDGHVILSRDIAQRGQFPAIDVLTSLSRVMDRIVRPEHLRAARAVGQLIKIRRENSTLIDTNIYKPGENPEWDLAIEMNPYITSYCQHRAEEVPVVFEESLDRLAQLVDLASRLSTKRAIP